MIRNLSFRPLGIVASVLVSCLPSSCGSSGRSVEPTSGTGELGKPRPSAAVK